MGRAAANHPARRKASALAAADFAAPAQAELVRLTHLLGASLALLVAGFFCYPGATWPAQNLALWGGVLMVTLALGALTWHGVGLLPAAGVRCAFHPVAAALAVLALWAAVRWGVMEIRFAGRTWTAALSVGAVAAATGLAAGSLHKTGGRATAGLWTAFTRTLALATLAFALLAFYQYFISYHRALADLRASLTGPVTDLQTQSLLHALSERRVGGRIGPTNLFAAQMAVLAVLSLSLVGLDPKKLWRVAGVAAWAGALGAVVLTRSRGGALTFALGTVLSVALLAGQWRLRGRGLGSGAKSAAVPLAMATLMGWAAASAPRTALAAETLWQRLGNIATIRERFFYWLIALRIWQRSPWTGEGPGSFELLYLQLKPAVARESLYAHSWFFQTLAELGVAGVAAWLVFWGAAGVAAWRLWRRARAEQNETATAARAGLWLAAALVTLGVNGLVEFSLQWMEFLFVLGLLAGWLAGLAARQEGKRAKALGWAGLGLAAACACVAIALLVPLAGSRWQSWHGEERVEDARQLLREGKAQAASVQWLIAQDHFERASAWLPDVPSLLVSRAHVAVSLGQTAQAETLLAQAARLNPLSASIPAAQARFYQDTGHPEKALACLDLALERYPSYVEYRLDRAELRLKTGGDFRPDIAYILDNDLLIYEYQQKRFDRLRQAAGL